MDHLESIQLGGNLVIDAVAGEAFGKVNSLKTLDVSEAKSVNADFLKAVSKLPKLENLSFNIAKISDGDFACFKKTRNLSYLNFGGAISDKQLMELAGHQSLSMIQNYSEKLTKGGIDTFLKATPAIKQFIHPLAR